MGESIGIQPGTDRSDESADAKLYFRRRIGQHLENLKREYLVLADGNPDRVDKIKGMGIGDYIRLRGIMHEREKKTVS